MFSAALGTQVIGSTIRPASYCGCIGYKATVGALNRGGSYDGLSQSATGVLATTLEDTWQVAYEIAVREAELGLSINISTSVDGAEQCCFAAGIPRHSVGYSLGFEGKTERLPDAKVMMLSARYAAGLPLWNSKDCYEHGPRENELMGSSHSHR